MHSLSMQLMQAAGWGRIDQAAAPGTDLVHGEGCVPICLLVIAALSCVQEIIDKVMNWACSCPEEHDGNQKRKLFLADRWALSKQSLSLPYLLLLWRQQYFPLFNSAAVQHACWSAACIARLQNGLMVSIFLMDNPLILLIKDLKMCDFGSGGLAVVFLGERGGVTGH